MIVVKLGGSLYNCPELTHWLKQLRTLSNEEAIVIVPGGGPFADQVRAAQKTHSLNDSTAHYMALLAMKQFGLMMIDIEPGCQIFSLKKTAPLSVWLPDSDLLSETSIKKNWDISSDSLALWLATKLNAEQLILVKRSTSNDYSIQNLMNENVLDQGFSDLFKTNPTSSYIIHYQSYNDLDSRCTLTLP